MTLNHRLKDGSNGADVTSTGKVFHTFTVAMGKARSPIELGFERGTQRTPTVMLR